VTTDFGGPNDTAQSVALQADGKIVVAGLSEQQSYDFALARYEGMFTGAILEPDTCDPTAMQLVVGGTGGDDKIKIHKAGDTGAVEVRLNGESLGTFAPTGRIIVYGYAGDDDIQISGKVPNSTWLYGDTGDDRLSSDAGNDVLLGGAGDDMLHGGNGRDLLIGGNGSDRLLGNSDDDILIAGATDHDALEAALCQIMDEWSRTDVDLATRVRRLEGPAGGGSADDKNGAYFLNAQTVQDDGLQDMLTGSSGSDWFFFNRDGDGDARKKDKATDMSTFEAMFAEDIDFINAA